jgi:FkbH-like protein
VTHAVARVAPYDERPLVDERLSEIKTDLEAGNYYGAVRALRCAIRVPQEPAHVRRFAALMTRIPTDAVEWRRRCRVAILSATTVADRAALLRLYLAADLVGAQVYEGGFGLIDEEVLDPTSAYNCFRPDITILSPSSHSCAHFEETEPDLDIDRWKRLWDTIQDRHKGRVILHALEVPRHSAFGNLDLTLSESVGRRIRQFNLDLAAATPAGVSVLDVEGLAASVGKRDWGDPRVWFLAKESTSAAGRVVLAHAEAALIRGFLGLSKKVLAVDLDNTLWGGVIGEDDLAGIRLGGDAVGEAFVAFQRYLKALRARGILLVLISKNNEEDARLPFERHPEMVLSWDDFASVRTNWRPKSDNLEEIAAELSVGLDAFVCVDDDPEERAELRMALPEVDVVCMPNDPSYFIGAVAEGRWFDVPALSHEDRSRAEDYRAAKESQRLMAAAGTLDEFLASLEMRAEIAAFDALNLPRIVQLMHRTNQFNLTNRRYTEVEVTGLMAASGVHPRFVRLRDRFSDRGIISVVIARERDDALDVETWLMSCRVLGRTVEHAVLSYLIELGVRLGKTRILGSYLPTARNALVKDHYARLGFTCVAEDPNGGSRWERPLAAPAPRSFVVIAPTGHALPATASSLSNLAAPSDLKGSGPSAGGFGPQAGP